MAWPTTTWLTTTRLALLAGLGSEARCMSCHQGRQSTDSVDTAISDADGDETEPLPDEVDTLASALLSEIELAALADSGVAICYGGHTYPYFFADTDGSGTCEETELDYTNGYADWTPRLMRAAFNYQLSQKDPAAWAHNFAYVFQLLVDSVDDLGGDVSAYTRP